MEHLDLVGKFLREPGVEIGAFKTPIPGIKPVYVDRFAEYARERTLSDYYGDACELPYWDSSLRYVATSHVLEHVANPLAALAEWYRVLEHNGVIYAVIPDWRRTFDHKRQPTELKHLLEDFRRGVTQSDATHIDDFVFGVDWGMFSPATGQDAAEGEQKSLAAIYHRSVEAGLEINIHFHVFSSEVLMGMIEMGNRERIWPGRIDVVRVEESFPSSNPNGFLIVARVRKPWIKRLGDLLSEKGIRKNARKFDDAGLA
ncbi:MAG TPA: methyltransferase domain-containing protein [Opitutaceae bacterium]|jgi:SAM-dependent methyltransferase|nr:methyltransferase domain-containing protein [Opitutaceae bacterium]